jgi:16S rRNA (uracil1498-N3)-methyltransferase
MGVAAIQPVGTAHGQVRVGALSRPGGAARWRRIAIASAKQCRRAVVPPILPARAFEDVVSATPAADERRILLVEPAASPAATPRALDLTDGSAPRSAVLAVGPEGGWSAPEVQAAVAHGWLPFTLGRRTLRADAVPVAAIAVLQFCWKDA